jgi:hypothetical protein
LPLSLLEGIQQKFSALCPNGFIPKVHYIYATPLVQLKLYILCKRLYQLDALFQIQFYLGSKFWKLFIFKFLFCVSETFLCSLSVLPVKTILLLDTLQLLLFVRTTHVDLHEVSPYGVSNWSQFYHCVLWSRQNIS